VRLLAESAGSIQELDQQGKARAAACHDICAKQGLAIDVDQRVQRLSGERAVDHRARLAVGAITDLPRLPNVVRRFGKVSLLEGLHNPAVAKAIVAENFLEPKRVE